MFQCNKFVSLILSNYMIEFRTPVFIACRFNIKNTMMLTLILNSIFFCSASYCQDAGILNDLAQLAPKPFISKIEFLGGSSILYPKVDYKDATEDSEISFGYSVGVNFIHCFSNKKINLVGGISLERKRFKNSNSNISQFIKGDLKNDYLTFSFIPRYSFIRNHFHIGIGGYIGVLQKSMSTIIYSDPNSGVSIYSTDSSYSLYNKYDAGLLINLGYTVSISEKSSFNCQLTNTNGFRPVSKILQPYLLSISKNNNISLLFGITFNL